MEKVLCLGLLVVFLQVFDYGPMEVNGAVTLGATGATGPRGPTGRPGPRGFSVGTYIMHIRGFTGETGPMGPSGAAGVSHVVGATGLKGVRGPPGEKATGPTGEAGPQGDRGPTGAKGPEGQVPYTTRYALVTSQVICPACLSVLLAILTTYVVIAYRRMMNDLQAQRKNDQTELNYVNRSVEKTGSI